MFTIRQKKQGGTPITHLFADWTTIFVYSMSSDVKLGTKGKQLIQEFEQFRPTLYDTDGAGHCTIGWGHLVHKGFCDGRENEAVFRQGISRTQGDKLFILDVQHAENSVNRMLSQKALKLSQDQFDALVSFAYNVGSGNLTSMMNSCQSSSPQETLEAIPACIRRYNKAGNRVLAGLTRRRNKEAELFEGVQ